MFTRLHVVSLALLLSACTDPGGANKPEGSTAAPKPVGTTPDAVKPDAPKPEPLPEVTVAVASVQLIQDCPDPAAEAAAAAADVPAAVAAPAVAPEAGSVQAPAMQARSMPSPGAMPAGKMAAGGTWTQPCTQSTVQLALRNPGKRDATLRVEAVRLVDAGTKKVLGPIVVRKPSVWNTDGIYRPWDEKVAVGADLKVGYRLADPDWTQVEAALGAGVNLYARPFVLEVDVSIDGVRQTVRSPEFVREQVHMIAT